MEKILTMTQKELDRIVIMKKIEEKTLTQIKAAEQIKISERQIRRLWKDYKKSGEEGLISKKRGRPSNRKTKKAISNKAVKLILKRYPDFGPTLAKEKLEENHQIKLSVETIRQLMIKKEIWKPKKAKRARIHQRRPRRDFEGELVQIDGSPHDWFEGRGEKCSLLVAIDDATSKIKIMRFVDAETTEAYYELMRGYIKRYGRPQALYSDRHSIFKVNQKEALTGTGMTQFGRALKELDIRLICANTPQAKGRVERANGILQDRLIKELRLKKINTKEEANKYLDEYTKEYNKKFGVKALSQEDRHRKLEEKSNLKEILANQETRVLSKNLTFQYNKVIYQIQTERPGYALRKAKIQVIGTEKEGVKVKYKNQELRFTTYSEQEKQGEISNGKDLNEALKARNRKPSRRHPWRR